ncbi:Xaa-Pro dipeptidyl-peptidase, partial [Streptomyces sp. NPDC059426]
MLTSRWRDAVIAAVAISTALAALPAGPASARPSTQPGGPPGAHVVDGRTQPVFSYPDAVREHLMVQTPVDSDGDGHKDRVAV